MTRTLTLTLIAATSIALAACAEEPEPEPSTPPTLTAPEVTCGPATEAMNQLYDIDYPVILEVSVQADDAERDLLRVRGEVAGYPIPELTDPDLDLRYTWSPPDSLDPMVCRGDVVVRFEAEDLDGNETTITEILPK